MSVSNILRVWFAALCLLTVATIGLSWLKNSPATLQPDAVELVPIASRDELKNLIKQGKRVVFVDAREEAEFDEEHLPGAVNMTLRDIRSAHLGELKQADVVIAYCLKDFRGFEVARSLNEAGVAHVKIMQPYGLNGWKAEKLPTAGKKGMQEDEAWQRLVVWGSKQEPAR